MPPREEQIVQIEAALRRRFFPMVPKVVIEGREDWTEWQHDIDRLSRSLADTLERAKTGQDQDYREIKSRIEELTEDLPELREILGNMVDAGISAQQA